MMVVPVMAAVTEHIGFGVTANLTYEPPYLFARRMSTLDHLTGGRVGWNNFGRRCRRVEAASDIFEAALTRLGATDPSEAIVVGDSPYDAEAACKISLRPRRLAIGGID